MMLPMQVRCADFESTSDSACAAACAPCAPRCGGGIHLGLTPTTHSSLLHSARLGGDASETVRDKIKHADKASPSPRGEGADYGVVPGSGVAVSSLRLHLVRSQVLEG